MSIIKKDNKTLVYPIDTNCVTKGTILVDDNNAYTCTLNQTDLETNKNKFYIMHIVQTDNKFVHYIRYGRIGEVGKISYKDYARKDDSKDAFEKQFKAKTGNKWNSAFTYKDGKYFFANVEYETTEPVKDIKQVDQIKSNLDERTQTLIKLISDIESMNKTLIELDIDPSKMPLGKISTDQIDKANDMLTQISAIVKSENIKDEKILSNLTKLCSTFYTLIPYATSARNKPPIISSKELVGTFTNLLEELKNLVVAVKILDNVKNNTNKHPCDAIYDQLNTTIKPLDKTSDMWNHINNYIKNTQGSTHKFKIEIMDIYDIERKSEKDIFDKYCTDNKIGNKTLLFHGSSIVNFCSIFQKGLLLNPESLGVYISGKMMGCGLYFASCYSKSVNYCNTETSNNIGAMLLCEVALGKPLEKTQSDHYLSDKSMKHYGTNSTFAIGKSTASPGIMIDDLRIPNNKMVKSDKNTVLLYDEYIVYNQSQVHQKYLLLFKKI
jgi:predicted DNA-binding WGR domain protein